MSKYSTLAKYLSSLPDYEVSLSFKEIEKILGFILPESAKKLRSWWANDRTHSQYKLGWGAAGYVVYDVDFDREIVKFRRATQVGRTRPKAYIATLAISGKALASELLKAHYGKLFRKTRINDRSFDFVSDDGKIIGELIIAKGNRPPSSYFTYIASVLWFLEKIDADEKFLVFFGDKDVPKEWLRHFGHLIKEIKFFFLDVKQRVLIPISQN